ncbi:MAG: rRNA maturation RNase YbeY [Flavobacteriaceae bacterium]|nr:rRNA maturation RNase YbeY [Flavobacteriaceae bacterium]
MINFFSETDFELPYQDFYRDWLNACMDIENRKIGNINFIFCDDEYLLDINRQHLNHDYYTDIITFDYSDQTQLNGDIFISVERVADNAYEYNTTFDNELSRVMVHGFLHMCGYKDATEDEQIQMRKKEDGFIEMLTHNSEGEE